MFAAIPISDEGVEPYLLNGEQRFRPMPSWHSRIQRYALALAGLLDKWQEGLSEPAYEVLNQAGYLLREEPLTSLRIPLSVVRGRFPTLESDLVPAIPLVAVEVLVGADTVGLLAERVDEYLECGVSAAWVLAPSSKAITVHRFGSHTLAFDSRHELPGDPELPGFSCRVADLFR